MTDTTGTTTDASPPATGTAAELAAAGTAANADLQTSGAVADEVVRDESGAVEWSPPATEPETGIALQGDYPANHRLRAERLADANKDEDPDGIVDADTIADAKGRLEGQRRAESEAIAAENRINPPLRANMKTEDLESIAKKQGVDISSATNNQERVDMIEAARAAGIAKPANGKGE